VERLFSGTAFQCNDSSVQDNVHTSDQFSGTNLMPVQWNDLSV